MDREDLSKEEKTLFGALPRKKEPPKHLENIILKKLRRKRLVRYTRSLFSLNRKFTTIAASILFFLLGYAFSEFKIPGLTNSEWDHYLLLLHQDENFNPSRQNDLIREYSQWLIEVRENGHEIQGERLHPKVEWFGDKFTSEPSATNRISGFFLLKTKSLETAFEIAQSSPHLKYKGQIELRKITKK